MPNQEITGISTQEFWARYAKKGAVGLVGGTLWIHGSICAVQALRRRPGSDMNLEFLTWVIPAFHV